MVEPAFVATLGLARDPFEVKAQPSDHAERRVIAGGGGDTDAMRVKLVRPPVDRRARGFGHEPLATRIAPEPVPELDALMQVRERLQPHHSKETPPDPI